MTPSLLRQNPVSWWTSGWLFHGQAGISEKTWRKRLRRGNLRQRLSLPCTASRKEEMLPERDLCEYSDAILSYSRCSPLSRCCKGGWLRKRYLWFRCFHGAPESYPSSQRVGNKCISICGGMELLSECGFLPFLKRAVLFPEQVCYIPLEMFRRIRGG